MKVTQWTRNLPDYQVTIDGQDVRGMRCFEASEEEGFVSCYFYPWVLDQDLRPRSYTRYGHVVITPDARPQLIRIVPNIPSALLKGERQ